MKKIITVLWLLIFTICFSVRIFAEDSIAPSEINLLNMTMLKGYKYDPEVGNYTDTLQLEMHQTYTLVMSYTYLTDHLTNITGQYISFDENDGSNSFEIYLNDDPSNQRAYVEFQSSTGWIDMHHVPVSDQHNYEIMLYKGTYLDFQGFVPYLMPTEVMSFGGVLPVDYDALPSLELIDSYVVAKDPYGNPISKTLITDAYSVSDKMPGTYRMVYETIYNHVRKKFYLDVKIIDLAKPILTIESPLDIPIHEKWSLTTIKNYISISDNVDTILSSDLIIVSDTYSQANLPGTYFIEVKAIDQSGNEASLTVTINLIDIVPPVVYAPSSIYLYNTDTPLSTTDIINHFEIRDAVDLNNVTLTLTVDEYMQTTSPGRYMMTYQAKDTQLNTTTFSIYIHVIDHQGPTFDTGNPIIERSTAELMSDEEIIEWFVQQSSSQGLSISSVSILYNEYTGNEDQEGEYYVYLTYMVGEEEVTSRMLISVEETPMPLWIWILGSVISFLLIILWIRPIIRHKKH